MQFILQSGRNCTIHFNLHSTRLSTHNSSLCTGMSCASDCTSVDLSCPYPCVAKLIACSSTELYLHTSRSTYPVGHLADVAEVSFSCDLYLELHA